MELVEWNDLKIQDGIQPGQVLKLNDGSVTASSAPVKEKEIVHVVKSSETLFSVARKYGVSIQELMDWNGKSDSGLHVGERLKVITTQ
jgi:membrane-bound lytic murein transglycosylase D